MEPNEALPRIIRMAETSSTNCCLRELLTHEPLPEGSVVVTENQTAGRGQMGNAWESEPGRNLTFSLVVYPEGLPVNRQFLLSQIVSLSVKETLELYTEGIAVKWPNDIYHHDRKICGILIENDLVERTISRSIIGIGVNINQEAFVSNAPNPVSLRQIIGKDTDRETFLASFLNLFYRHYLALLQGEEEEAIRQAYRAALYRGEGYYGFADEQGSFEACIQDIRPTGHLVLRRRDGTLTRYAFKEVSYV